MTAPTRHRPGHRRVVSRSAASSAAARAVCRLTIAIAAALAVVPAAPAVAAPGSGHPARLEYVALGDSYSAGFGLMPFSQSPAPGCYQAEQNYPHRVAAALALRLTDVTCSGAVTANIVDTPQVTRQGTAPVQSDALSADTDFVTVTIGGNDLGFAPISAFCMAQAAQGPLLVRIYNNCRMFFQPVPVVDQLLFKLEYMVAPALHNAFTTIKLKAPHAKIFVIGYPAIAPDAAHTPAGGCFTSAIGNGSPPFPRNSFPFTDVDVPYLHMIEGKLNDTIRQQAEAVGATFISTSTQTAAHSACAPADRAYVNGITLLQAPVNLPVTPTPDPNIAIELGALHPNVAGVSFLGTLVADAIRAALPANTRN